MATKHENTLKIIGRILELIGVPILIIVAVLLNMENKDLATINVLLIIGVSTFLIGLVLSHLPQESMEGKRKNAKQTNRVRSPSDSYGCSDSNTNFSCARL